MLLSFHLFCAVLAAARPKHILFLMIDDLGFNDVSYRNTSDISSPHIDKLANAGIKLERYYTHNLCSPSRVSFLSGRFASTMSNQGCVIINGQAVDLPRNVATVADRLSRNGTGFATAAFGKWDAGMTTWSYTPTCRGFDYFYGYWNAAQDYYTHGGPHALDMHENFDTDRSVSGEYSTTLYTRKAQAWIEQTQAPGASKKDNTFLYLAYQAMHGPIEAPEEYVNTEFCKSVTTANKRNVYCGMMACLDEGIANLTATYERLGIWDDTLVVLAADNGGHVGSSGNNFPLRGEKSTNYEGGVRAVGFIHWPNLPAALQGTTTDVVVHVADWLPTFVRGVAGFPLVRDQYAYPLDGVDQWAALTRSPAARGSSSASSTASGTGRAIVHEIGGDNRIRQESYFDPPYKLIRFFPTIYDHGQGAVCETFNCPLGWSPLPGRGDPVPPPSAENATNTSAPGVDAFLHGGTWLFDVFADPLEHRDLSQTAEGKPIVARLVAALAARSALPGLSWSEQAICPNDPRSNPAKFFNNTVTPWRGARAPSCSAGDDPYPFPACLPPRAARV
jgi:arylsulfatase B/arylsulfatase I/J